MQLRQPPSHLLYYTIKFWNNFMRSDSLRIFVRAFFFFGEREGGVIIQGNLVTVML